MTNYKLEEVNGKRYDSLIFDLDGTLWNVNESCTNAWNDVLEGIGSARRITIEEMNSATGKPMEDIMEKLLPGDGFDHKELYRLLNTREEELIGRQGTYLYPGMLEEMERLAGKFRLFLVSNCQEWYLKRFLDYSGAGRHLSGWNCYGSSGQGKHLMISGIKAKNNIIDAVYIGDTALDRDSAVLSGTDFVQVTYGFGLQLEGEIRFDNFSDLSEYLMKFTVNGNR